MNILVGLSGTEMTKRHFNCLAKAMLGVNYSERDADLPLTLTTL